jgi:hypothetical protein
MLNVSLDTKCTQSHLEKVENRIQLLRTRKEMLDRALADTHHCTREAFRAKTMKTETELVKATLKDVSEEQLMIIREQRLQQNEDRKKRWAMYKEALLVQKQATAKRSKRERRVLEMMAQERVEKDVEKKASRRISMQDERKVSKMAHELSLARQMELQREDYLNRMDKRRALNQDCIDRVRPMQLKALELEETQLIEAVKDSWQKHSSAQGRLREIAGQRPKSEASQASMKGK